MQDFLENGVYRQPSEAPKQTAEKFMRKMGRKEPGVPYLVTSKAPDKRSEEWRRVVAVFVTGQTWQFKEWPHEVDPASSFCLDADASFMLKRMQGVAEPFCLTSASFGWRPSPGTSWYVKLPAVHVDRNVMPQRQNCCNLNGS